MVLAVLIFSEGFDLGDVCIIWFKYLRTFEEVQPENLILTVGTEILMSIANIKTPFYNQKSLRYSINKTVCQLIGEFVIIIVQTSAYFQNTNNKEDFFCFHIVQNAQANVISFQLNSEQSAMFRNPKVHNKSFSMA